jgi:hypothetical protein
MTDKIKLIGIVPFAENKLACLESNIGRAANDQLQITRIKILEKRMCR